MTGAEESSLVMVVVVLSVGPSGSSTSLSVLRRRPEAQNTQYPVSAVRHHDEGDRV